MLVVAVVTCVILTVHMYESACQSFFVSLASDAFRVHPTPAAQSHAATAADHGEWDREVQNVAASLPSGRAWST